MEKKTIRKRAKGRRIDNTIRDVKIEREQVN